MDDRGQCFKFCSPCFLFLSRPIPNFIIPSWFFFLLPSAFYVYSFYSLTLRNSPSLRSYSSTIHLLEPSSLTTIKRLDFKGKSRESQAMPLEWHRIKLLGALEPQMGWIPQDLSSAPLPFVLVVSVRAQNTVRMNGRSETLLVVTIWLLVFNCIYSRTVRQRSQNSSHHSSFRRQQAKTQIWDLYFLPVVSFN